MALGRFAWAVLAYNLAVVLWGAYVRVSFSGDGCGAHWPFCNGQVIPHGMASAMAIEFTHRLMTSFDCAGAIILCAWAFLAFPRRHPARLFSVLAILFLLVEALLGAGLVLLRYVARDQSAGRAVYLSAHLTNTMLLLAVLTIAAWTIRNNQERIAWRGISRQSWWMASVVILVSITGAIAALGDTLFPASSLAMGMQRDFSNSSSLLLRLRLIHPVIAIGGAAYVVWGAVAFLRKAEEDGRRAAGRVLTLVLIQLAAGAVNLTLLAPVWMQLIHLLLADLVWIGVVLMILESARTRPAHFEAAELCRSTFERS
ncbi:MAG: COX15/CtaA family protein [Acidobacteriaceae bacterium]|nr:COX15/CtaA family protein [Acidobacteriaceae bacterium]